MKNCKIVAITLLFTSICFAQNNINYKAIIKDSGGNILANQSVDLQFIIYEGAALTNNIYQESHTTNTDNNGIVIVNIGEGTTTDVFADVAWGNDEHWLNVQVNTGAGLVDLGTTQFMAVPYALQAEKAANVFSGDYTDLTNVPAITAPTGLEALDEGNGQGHRIIGRNLNNLGNIGLNAIDLSGSPIASTTYGATGEYAVAMNRQTTAQGQFSTAMGLDSKAFGNTSTVMGFNTVANGFDAVAMGSYTVADASQSLAIGRYNVGGGNNQVWNPNDPIFEIGIGSGSMDKLNAVTVLKNGNVGIGNTSPTQKVVVDGKIKIGDDATSGSEGTIRYDQTSSNFEGHNGTDWMVLNNKQQVYVDGSYDINLGSTIRNSETDYANPIIVPEDGKYLLSVAAYFSSTINEQYASGTPSTDAPYDNRGRLKIYINNVEHKLLEVGNGIIDLNGSTYRVSFAPGTRAYSRYLDLNQGDEIKLTKNMQAVPANVPNLSIPDLWIVSLDTFHIIKMD